MDLIANHKMLVNIRVVQEKDEILVHCNRGVKIVKNTNNLPGYENVWYKPIGIPNILLMSRVIRIFRMVFDSEGGSFFRIVLPDREVRFHLIPNGIYYFDAADHYNSVLLINTFS